MFFSRKGGEHTSAWSKEVLFLFFFLVFALDLLDNIFLLAGSSACVNVSVPRVGKSCSICFSC